jgi:hypothetical protein
MPAFELESAVTVTAYTIVEAASLEEALDKAARLPVRLMLAGDADVQTMWVIDEADGSPKNIRSAQN